MILGLQSVLLDPDTRRRRMYGKAGAFRFKKYGKLIKHKLLINK